MTVRVPDAGPDERERQQTIEHLRKQLRRFQRVPSRRRETECAERGGSHVPNTAQRIRRRCGRRPLATPARCPPSGDDRIGLRAKPPLALRLRHHRLVVPGRPRCMIDMSGFRDVSFDRACRVRHLLFSDRPTFGAVIPGGLRIGLPEPNSLRLSFAFECNVVVGVLTNAHARPASIIAAFTSTPSAVQTDNVLRIRHYLGRRRRRLSQARAFALPPSRPSRMPRCRRRPCCTSGLLPGRRYRAIGSGRIRRRWCRRQRHAPRSRPPLRKSGLAKEADDQRKNDTIKITLHGGPPIRVQSVGSGNSKATQLDAFAYSNEVSITDFFCPTSTPISGT